MQNGLINKVRDAHNIAHCTSIFHRHFQSVYCLTLKGNWMDANTLTVKERMNRSPRHECNSLYLLSLCFLCDPRFTLSLSLSPLVFHLMRQLISILDATLGKISRYDEGNILAPILSITVSVVCHMSPCLSLSIVHYLCSPARVKLVTMCCEGTLMTFSSRGKLHAVTFRMKVNYLKPYETSG